MTGIALPWQTGAPHRPALSGWFPPLEAELSMAAAPPDSSGTGADGADPWEAQCIRETQRGRPESFNPLVTRYAPRIRAYLFRMVRNREEAEDLTQETFIKAFRALPRFRAERPFRRWLYAIATNTGLNALRGRSRRGTAVEVDFERLAAEPTHGAAPDGREEALAEALACLPARSARLVALHYEEGFTLAEAGEVLGMTESAAKVALCRARRQLRETMTEGDRRDL